MQSRKGKVQKIFPRKLKINYYEYRRDRSPEGGKTRSQYMRRPITDSFSLKISVGVFEKLLWTRGVLKNISPVTNKKLTQIEH